MMQEGNSHIVTMEMHAKYVLSKLEEFYQSRMFSDIIVTTLDGEEFSAHKVVLASNSPFLQKIFLQDDVQNISIEAESSSVKTILDFMYTSSLSLTSDNVETIRTLAVVLHMNNVDQMCDIYLQTLSRDDTDPGENIETDSVLQPLLESPLNASPEWDGDHEIALTPSNHGIHGNHGDVLALGQIGDDEPVASLSSPIPEALPVSGYDDKSQGISAGSAFGDCHGVLEHVCGFCSMAFPTPISLRCHIRRRHSHAIENLASVITSRGIIKKYRDQRNKRRDKLRECFNRRGRNIGMSSRSGKIVCNVCGKYFSHQIAHNKHCVKKHPAGKKVKHVTVSRPFESKKQIKLESEIDVSVGRINYANCPKCDIVLYKGYKDALDHLRQSHDMSWGDIVGDVDCSAVLDLFSRVCIEKGCGFTAANIAKLDSHMQKEHCHVLFHCEFCKLQFRVESSYLTHLHSHETPKSNYETEVLSSLVASKQMAPLCKMAILKDDHNQVESPMDTSEMADAQKITSPLAVSVKMEPHRSTLRSSLTSLNRIMSAIPTLSNSSSPKKIILKVVKIKNPTKANEEPPAANEELCPTNEEPPPDDLAVIRSGAVETSSTARQLLTRKMLQNMPKPITMVIMKRSQSEKKPDRRKPQKVMKTIKSVSKKSATKKGLCGKKLQTKKRTGKLGDAKNYKGNLRASGSKTGETKMACNQKLNESMVENWPCSFCDKVYRRKERVMMHERTHLDTTFKCPSCSKAYTEARLLVMHILKQHRMNPLECPHCQTGGHNRSELRHCIYIRHKSNYKKTLELLMSSLTTTEEDSPTDLLPSKETCIANFKSEVASCSFLKVEPKPDGKLECPECGRAFSSQSHLVRHRRVHAGYVFSCPACSRPFSEKRDLEVHFRAKHENNPLQCEFCASTFTSRAGFSNHMRRHKGDFRHECPICSEKFIVKCDYDTHVAKHDGLKPHTCPICGSGFSHASSFSLHKKSCGKNLGKFLCSECGQAYKSEKGLKMHVRRHRLPEERAQCYHCGNFFASTHTLKKHIRNKHRDVKNSETETETLRRTVIPRKHRDVENSKSEIETLRRTETLESIHTLENTFSVEENNHSMVTVYWNNLGVQYRAETT